MIRSASFPAAPLIIVVAWATGRAGAWCDLPFIDIVDHVDLVVLAEYRKPRDRKMRIANLTCVRSGRGVNGLFESLMRVCIMGYNLIKRLEASCYRIRDNICLGCLPGETACLG